jgi:choice-of-anchor A domain-containing protein
MLRGAEEFISWTSAGSAGISTFGYKVGMVRNSRSVIGSGLSVAFGAVTVASLVLFAPGSAMAATLCGGTLEGAAGYSEFIFSTANPGANTDVTGSVAYGGAGTFTNFTVDPSGVAKSVVTFVDGGDVDGSQLNLNDGSGVYAGTKNNPDVYVNSGGSFTKVGAGSLPVNFSQAQTALDADSLNDASLAATGTITTEGASNPPVITLTGTNTQLNVFTLSASSLAAAGTSSAGTITFANLQEININVPDGATTLINVAGSGNITFPALYAIEFWNGSGYTQSNPSLSGTAGDLQTRTLWNFPTATGFTIGYGSMGLAWGGTILAPDAALTTAGYGQVNGSLIANSYTNPANLEVHDVLFPSAGCLPPNATPAASTPQGAPVILGVLGIGVVCGAFVLLRRRGRRLVA